MEENTKTVQPNQPKIPEVPNNVTPSAGSSKIKLYILTGIGVLVLILVGYLVTQKPNVNTQTKQVVKPTAIPSPTLARSKAPGVIVSVVNAKGVDPKTGEALNPVTTFLSTDKSIYAVTTLKNAKIGTYIEYVRYLNGKFLDNRSVKITKANTNNVSFVWTLKNSTAAHPAGEYRVKVYTNGIFEKEISYTVK